MLLVLDQRERLCSISEEADFGFSFSSNCWFRTECANCKKVVEPMGLSFRWQKIAKLHNRKSIWKRKIKNAMLTLWIWYCKEETEQSGIADVSLEWILKGGREGFFFFYFFPSFFFFLCVCVCLERMGLSFGWDAASCFNSKCVCSYGMPFRFLTVNVQVETTNDFKFLAVLRCLSWNQWVWRLVLSFSYCVTFLINFYTWQIFKWGVFLHVAMALIAGKGLNPPIIGLLNQNSQKRTSTQGSFIPLNTSTFYITLIFSSSFFFFLATKHGAQKLSQTTTWPYKWTKSSRKGQSEI